MVAGFLITPKEDDVSKRQVAALFLPKKEREMKDKYKGKGKVPAVAIIVGMEKPMKEKKKKMMGGGAVVPMMPKKPMMAKGGMAKKKC